MMFELPIELLLVYIELMSTLLHCINLNSYVLIGIIGVVFDSSHSLWQQESILLGNARGYDECHPFILKCPPTMEDVVKTTSRIAIVIHKIESQR